MPKVSTSSRGKTRSKNRRGGQYHDAAIIRKLRKSRFKGILEVIEFVKPRQTPDVELDWFGRKMQANSEVNTANPVNLNKPRVIMLATAK